LEGHVLLGHALQLSVEAIAPPAPTAATVARIGALPLAAGLALAPLAALSLAALALTATLLLALMPVLLSVARPLRA
jgi:hypothetical protein